MEYSKSYILGMALGIVLALALFVVAFFIAKGKRRYKYDERQQLARGKAYKYGFWVMVAYYMVHGLSSALGFRWCDELTGAMIGVLLGAMTLALICVKNDAYIALNERPKRVMLLLGIIAACNLITGIPHLITGDYITGGVVNFRIANFLCAVMVLVMMAAVTIKRLCERSAEDEPHEEP